MNNLKRSISTKVIGALIVFTAKDIAGVPERTFEWKLEK